MAMHQNRALSNHKRSQIYTLFKRLNKVEVQTSGLPRRYKIKKKKTCSNWHETVFL